MMIRFTSQTTRVSAIFVALFILLTLGCGGKDKELKNAGTATVTYSGAAARTTSYGKDSSSYVICQHHTRTGEFTIALFQPGDEDRYEGADDGVFFRMADSLNPEDWTTLGESDASGITVVLKEFRGSDHTFGEDQVCSFTANMSGATLSAKFRCRNLSNSDGQKVSVTGSLSCKLEKVED